MLGIFAVVLCSCVVASVLRIFAVVLCGCVVVAGSVVFDEHSLLLCSVGDAVTSSPAEASETAIEKGMKKFNMIDWSPVLSFKCYYVNISFHSIKFFSLTRNCGELALYN